MKEGRKHCESDADYAYMCMCMHVGHVGRPDCAVATQLNSETYRM